MPFVTRQVTRSLARLEAITERLASDRDSLAAQGIELVAWSPDVESNTVSIRIARYSETAIDALTQSYGDAISVVSGDFGASASLSRTADGSPWNGADKVSTGSGTCTTWFSLRKNGSPYNAVAGHCGTGAVKNNGVTQGTVTSANLKWVSGGYADIGIYPVSGNVNWVWANPGATERGVTAVQNTDPPPGSAYFCTDG